MTSTHHKFVWSKFTNSEYFFSFIQFDIPPTHSLRENSLSWIFSLPQRKSHHSQMIFNRELDCLFVCLFSSKHLFKCCHFAGCCGIPACVLSVCILSFLECSTVEGCYRMSLSGHGILIWENNEILRKQRLLSLI